MESVILICLFSMELFDFSPLDAQLKTFLLKVGVHCDQHLPKKSGNMFVVNCPVCRAPIEPSYLEEDLQFAVYDVDNSGWGNQGTDLVGGQSI